jgi:hypothetical protein
VSISFVSIGSIAIGSPSLLYPMAVYTVNFTPSAEVIDAGRHLIRQMPFTKECNSHRDYSWGPIIRSCLVGDIGAAIVKDVCRRLKEAVSAYTAYSFYNDDLIAGLFAVHPTTAPDAFCGGELKQLEQGLRMIQDLRQNPLDAVPENELFA